MSYNVISLDRKHFQTESLGFIQNVTSFRHVLAEFPRSSDVFPTDHWMQPWCG